MGFLKGWTLEISSSWPPGSNDFAFLSQQRAPLGETEYCRIDMEVGRGLGSQRSIESKTDGVDKRAERKERRKEQKESCFLIITVWW